MSADKPRILLVNDDGIESPYLPRVIAALAPVADLQVAVPAEEQSWKGKAMTRFGPVRAVPHDSLGVPAFTVAGTPADCVNLAVHHLFPQRPDWLFSGINIGANVGTSFLLNSGTVCAAFEGALQGVPAVAFSARFPPRLFAQWMTQHHLQGDAGEALLGSTAQHAARLMQKIMTAGLPPEAMVLNVNFPGPVSQETPVEWAPLSSWRYGSLFVEDQGAYHLRGGGKGSPAVDGLRGDREVLEAGAISLTPLSIGAMALPAPGWVY